MKNNNPTNPEKNTHDGERKINNDSPTDIASRYAISALNALSVRMNESIKTSINE